MNVQKERTLVKNADTERFVITEGNRAEVALFGVHDNVLLGRCLLSLYMFSLTVGCMPPKILSLSVTRLTTT